MQRSISKILRPAFVRSFAAHYPPIIGSKVVPNVAEAISEIQDGQTLVVGGYGPCGIPQTLINAIAEKNTKNMRVIVSTAGGEDYGITPLLKKGQIDRLITSEVEKNSEAIKEFKRGGMSLEFHPQGSLAEKLRAGGLGIPAFYTPTGVGTSVEEGGIPVRYSSDGKTVVEASAARERRMFHGRDYIMERQLLGDWALVRAWKADGKGNCIFKMGARNFNPDVAGAGKTCIVEADEICQIGDFDGDDVHLSGIFVHKVIQGDKHPTKLLPVDNNISGDKVKSEILLKRAAQEIKDGMYVHLHRGLPKKLRSHLPAGVDVDFFSESGILGEIDLEGEPNPDLISNDFSPISLKKGAAVVKASDSFAAVRGGHLNLSIVSAKQVSKLGDVCNWVEGPDGVEMPGSSLDMVTSVDVVALMEHTDKDGNFNIVDNPSLRVSGKGVLSKLITDMGVFEWHELGMTLVELHPDYSLADVKAKTGCDFEVLPNFKKMDI